MRRITLLIVSLISAVCLHAQTAGELDASFDKARKELDAAKKEFADSADAALAAYLAYEEKLFEEYLQFRSEVMRTWGDSVMVESTRKAWVEYSDDRTSRSSVNWETGEVAVEVLVDPDDSPEVVKEKMEKAVAELLASRGKPYGFDTSLHSGKTVSKKPILDGQLDLSAYGVTSLAYDYDEAPKPFGNQGTSKPAPSRGGRLDLSRNKTSAPKPTVPTVDDSSSVPANVDSAAAQSLPDEFAAAAALAEQQAKELLAQEQKAVEQRAKELQAQQKKAQEQREKEQKALEKKAKEQREKEQREKEQREREQKAKEQEALAKLPEAIVESKTPTVETVNTAEGTKNVVTITMELVEDHIPKRAEQFKTMINTHSDSYSVAEPLIYAIMEQESAFNPMAQSWVPAYGLMQLVPKSGGRDAYRYVHKVDEIPSAEFLFDANNNIQLGTGYLKLLMSTTFKKVTDERCKMLCAIAAYNTGAGNVSRAINGTTNISKAIPTINTMSYDQLFEYLKQHLPHAETKDYIQKVTSKMEKYMK